MGGRYNCVHTAEEIFLFVVIPTRRPLYTEELVIHNTVNQAQT